MNEIDIAVVIVTYKSAQLAIECLRPSIPSEKSQQHPKIRRCLGRQCVGGSSRDRAGGRAERVVILGDIGACAQERRLRLRQ